MMDDDRRVMECRLISGLLLGDAMKRKLRSENLTELDVERVIGREIL
jgi:hypothetical protein